MSIQWTGKRRETHNELSLGLDKSVQMIWLKSLRPSDLSEELSLVNKQDHHLDDVHLTQRIPNKTENHE